jgi:hypothetical protein
MQKPLKHDQRHEHENEPDEAEELGHNKVDKYTSTQASARLLVYLCTPHDTYNV